MKARGDSAGLLPTAGCCCWSPSPFHSARGPGESWRWNHVTEGNVALNVILKQKAEEDSSVL